MTFKGYITSAFKSHSSISNTYLLQKGGRGRARGHFALKVVLSVQWKMLLPLILKTDYHSVSGEYWTNYLVWTPSFPPHPCPFCYLFSFLLLNCFVFNCLYCVGVHWRKLRYSPGCIFTLHSYLVDCKSQKWPIFHE